jgi:hypothetical protein
MSARETLFLVGYGFVRAVPTPRLHIELRR